MKNVYLLIALVMFSKCACAQVKLSESDLQKLIEIGEFYSSNVMLNADSTFQSLEKLRTEKLSNIVDVLQIQALKSPKILSTKYLSRPSYEDLVMWYVIREIHYNLVDDENEPELSETIAKATLEQQIDVKWLLDNYYYRLYSAVAVIFNEEDLSSYNIEINTYGLQNETERAILFLNLIDALSTRFRVLQMLNKHAELLEFAAKMPQFNGKPYFYYTDFDYKDFKWIGHRKEEMFNEKHIGMFYEITLAHLNAESETNRVKMAQEIYYNSILFRPEYFKYTSKKSDLKKLYKRSKKR